LGNPVALHLKHSYIFCCCLDASASDTTVDI
jgi:hypothetical protein